MCKKRLLAKSDFECKRGTKLSRRKSPWTRAVRSVVGLLCCRYDCRYSISGISCVFDASNCPLHRSTCRPTYPPTCSCFMLESNENFLILKSLYLAVVTKANCSVINLMHVRHHFNHRPIHAGPIHFRKFHFQKKYMYVLRGLNCGSQGSWKILPFAKSVKYHC